VKRNRHPSLRVLAVDALLFLALFAAPAALAAPHAGESDDAADDSSFAGAAATSASAGVEALRLQLEGLLRTGVGRSGEWAVMALSLDQGDTLFALNQDAPLTPASNQKILTSAAALHHLGPDFRFATFLLADGPVAEGVLEGNLVLYGTGDPALTDRHLPSAEAPFREFARTLRERGIHAVRGDVLGDGTYFDGPPRRPSWNARDLNEWYAAPVSALSFNENMVTLRISPGSPGGPPRVRMQPAGGLVPIANGGTTVAGRARATLMLVRDDPDEPIELRGEMGAGQADVWRRLTVSDPAGFAASVFRRVLEEEGIRVEGESRAVDGERGSLVTRRVLVAPAFGTSERPRPWTVAVHHSPPLSELLEVVNKQSHNLYSELVFHVVGRIALGDGSFDGGGQALTDYLVRVAGVPTEGLRMEDGSGLSRLNRAPASTFVRVLEHMERHEHRDIFWASLPEAGNRRELGRMFQSAAAGNLRAKTGTIHRVSSLSGIVRSADGEAIVFSIIANDVPSASAKRLEDRIGIQLASFSRPFEPPTAPLRVDTETGGVPASARVQDGAR
jgi:serine-type D-Ala-D-Ala carboxypeptidase/endopeptidase (penicillin-binding protein 4)